MKILKLEFQNIASFADVQIIDFDQEPLRSAGIFAITGPTGAGKSSVLDALCLALFEKVPRYEGVDRRDLENEQMAISGIKNMVRRGADHAYVRVHFVGIDQEAYGVIWKVEKTSRGANRRLKDSERLLFRLNDEQIIENRKSQFNVQIEQRLGLDFEQFRRSVMLAQGDFALFLKASKDNKSRILEKISGQSIYSSISKAVHKRHSEHQQQMVLLQKQLEQFQLLTDEELAQYQEQKDAYLKSLTQYKQQRQSFEKALEWYALATRKKDALQQVQDAIALQEKDVLDLKDNKTDILIYDAMFALQTSLYEWQSIQQSLERLEADKHKEGHQIATLKALQVQQQEDLTKKQQVFEQAQAAYDAFLKIRPALNEWEKRILKEEHDVTIQTELQEQLHKKLADIDTQLPVQIDHIKQLDKALKDVEDWLLKHDSKKELLNVHHVLSNHLSLLEKHLQDQKSYQDKLMQWQSQEQLLNEKVNQIHQTIESLVSDKQQAFDVSEDDLKNELLKWSTLHQLYEQAVQLEDDCAIKMQLIATHQSAMAQQENLQAQFEAEDNEVKQAMIDAQSRLHDYESTLRVLQNQLGLAQYIPLLQDNEPCPLCGSVDHPQPIAAQTQHILDDVNRQFQKCKDEINNLQTKQDQLQKQKDASVLTYKTHQIALKADNVALEHLHEQLTKLRTLALDWDFELNITGTNKATIQTQLTYWEAKKVSFDEWQKAKHLWQVKYDEALGQQKMAEVESKNLIQRIEETHTQLSDVRQRIANVKQAVDKLLNGEDWYDKWLVHPQHYQERLHQFVKQFESQLQLQQQLTKDMEQAKVVLQNLEQDHLQTKQALQSATQLIEEKLESIEQVKAQIVAHIGSLDVQQVETNYRNQLRIGRLTVDKALQENQDIQMQLGQHQTLLNSLEQRWETMQMQRKQLESALDKQLVQNDVLSKAFDGVESMVRYWFSNKDRLQALKAHMVALEDALKSSRIKVQVLEKEWEEHLTLQPSDTLEQCQLGLEQLMIAIQETEGMLEEVQYQLRQQQQFAKQRADVLNQYKDLESAYASLNTLHALIGSHDGKKFNEKAQEVTLDYVLQHANAQLNLLNKRYQLKRMPNSLSLEVVDLEMGYENRPVHSLSGGETFIVSLALALGLSTINATQVKVESMFIDEGFGTLDAQTLSIALDALERLHLQGRKIGVISHVAELQERVSVQLQITKQNGISQLEVVQLY